MFNFNSTLWQTQILISAGGYLHYNDFLQKSSFFIKQSKVEACPWLNIREAFFACLVLACLPVIERSKRLCRFEVWDFPWACSNIFCDNAISDTKNYTVLIHSRWQGVSTGQTVFSVTLDVILFLSLSMTVGPELQSLAFFFCLCC